MPVIAAASEQSGSDDLAIILSVVATAKGLLGFGLAALVAFQNRPSVSVTANAMSGKQEGGFKPLAVVVFVANTGGSPSR